MNDLFWALYWIDVLSGCEALLFFPFIAFLLHLLVKGIALEERITKKGIFISMVAGLIVGLVFMLVPSKQTMYLMLGVKTTENVMQSDFGKKIQKIVDQELDKLMSSAGIKQEK
jgi:Na+/proline symporter